MAAEQVETYKCCVHCEGKSFCAALPDAHKTGCCATNEYGQYVCDVVTTDGRVLYD